MLFCCSGQAYAERLQSLEFAAFKTPFKRASGGWSEEDDDTEREEHGETRSDANAHYP